MHSSILPTNGGKALNLSRLQLIPGVIVPAFIVLSADMPEAVCREIVERFIKDHSFSHVAVRSSATSEDSSEASFAGVYETKLNVPAITEKILEAVWDVRKSGTSKIDVVEHYAKERGLPAGSQSVDVIVQEMISSETSGVIFSHSLFSRDGYYVVSIARGCGDLVVSGLINGELVRVARSINIEKINDACLAVLINTMRTIESNYGSESLDVEFTFAGDVLYILQCRPITTAPAIVIRTEDEDDLARQLVALEKDVNERYKGDILGDMMDINPLELLGQNPSALDISIFRYLFADSIVERVRREMGYDPLDVGLIRVVEGKPYVSLRASAFSFRPKGVSVDVYERMLEVYHQQLSESPYLQSRVEFDVFAMGCGAKLDEVMSFAKISANDQKVTRNAFRELEDALVNTSDECRNALENQWKSYSTQLSLLVDMPLHDILAHVAVGTEQFVRVARLAFYWKNRFEERYPEENLNDLIVGHIHSVSTRMQADLLACSRGEISREDLIKRYGHLRPGQFSMFGEAYSDDPEYYLFSRLSNMSAKEITKRKHKYEDTVEFKNVVAFMQAREETKFLFSQALHVFVTQLEVALKVRGVGSDCAASMQWSELDMLFGMCNQTADQIKCDLRYLPKHLPEVIIPGKTHLSVIEFGEAMASYVTNEVVKASIQVLSHPDERVDVRGKIVLIPYADPGYDFLFHSEVAGIVSRVGGPASHMCIRAIELQVPACIGCGERMYDELLSSEFAILDCASRQIICRE